MKSHAIVFSMAIQDIVVMASSMKRVISPETVEKP
jgi:hypothetical protein